MMVMLMLRGQVCMLAASRVSLGWLVIYVPLVSMKRAIKQERQIYWLGRRVFDVRC